MAHHWREHWASQHTWQTMPAEADGQHSAGSGTWAPQSEQVEMVGSGIANLHHGGPVGHGRVVGGFQGWEQLSTGQSDAAAFDGPGVLAVCGAGSDEHVGDSWDRLGHGDSAVWVGMDPPSSRRLAGWVRQAQFSDCDYNAHEFFCIRIAAFRLLLLARALAGCQCPKRQDNGFFRSR